MKKETYEAIFDKICAHRYGKQVIAWSGTVITYVTAVLYFLVVLLLFRKGNAMDIAAALLVPALSFVLVTLFRHVINAKRPYEIHGFTPLIAKDKTGHSFPSRHVFSIFVIATTVFWFYPMIGIMVWVMGAGLALIRVVSGVHFPRDVIAGMAIGILCGCLTAVIR